jgi:hypothetical protein
VQEGDDPAEEPRDMLPELERVAEERRTLVRAINRANAATAFDAGALTDALARRDVLRWQAGAYRDIAAGAAITQDRFSRSEIKVRSTVDVAAVLRRADDLAREAPELAVRIQAANRTTALIAGTGPV